MVGNTDIAGVTGTTSLLLLPRAAGSGAGKNEYAAATVSVSTDMHPSGATDSGATATAGIGVGIHCGRHATTGMLSKPANAGLGRGGSPRRLPISARSSASSWSCEATMLRSCRTDAMTMRTAETVWESASRSGLEGLECVLLERRWGDGGGGAYFGAPGGEVL